jgi:hypothetical protein
MVAMRTVSGYLMEKDVWSTSIESGYDGNQEHGTCELRLLIHSVADACTHVSMD